MLTEREFIEHIAEPELELLEEQLHAAYKKAPLVHAKGDHFHCCPLCGNLLLRTNKNILICEDDRCRTKRNSEKPGRTI
ncbi:hypothetical protein [Desulfonema magnum]|uniref:Uncharacterized protein n=1 Tax=Desulfonema magnum TaxID=45655 RepID=A0A975BFD7_9BACT|nr:hypothetical protein [Desulfonema magnum]QTA84421.1 Uncharacterized protein dnm_004170 [Desulfonema magnum]